MAGSRLQAATALLLLGVSAISHSAVLDQNTLLPQPVPGAGGFGGYGLFPGVRTGQTFEVGITGYLERIDVQFSFLAGSGLPAESAEFSIYALSEEGLPTAEAIATAWLAPPQDFDPTFFGHYTLSLDFSDQDVFFQANESYALVTETGSLSAPWGTWIDNVLTGSQDTIGDRYDRGSGIYEGFDTPWENLDITDPAIAFDASLATYMRPVPLPGAWLLLGSGVLVLATRHRRCAHQDSMPITN